MRVLVAKSSAGPANSARCDDVGLSLGNRKGRSIELSATRDKLLEALGHGLDGAGAVRARCFKPSRSSSGLK